MADWSQPQQIVELAAFYDSEAKDPIQFKDEEFTKIVKKAFWGTNCWSFVEAAFAVIAPACARRPHLTKELIRSPIEAMMQVASMIQLLLLPKALYAPPKLPHTLSQPMKGSSG